MIHKIYGQVTEKKEQSLILRSGFFELELLISSFCLDAQKIYDEVGLFTYLYVREDELRLFGFLNLNERAIFEDLISVDGIGPKAALRILSSIKYDEFRYAIEKEDVELISKVKGIGKKTAGKIFLKLRDKLVKLDTDASLVSNFKEVEESIVNMGFDRRLVNIKIKEVLLLEDFQKFRESEKEQFLFREVIKRVTG